MIRVAVILGKMDSGGKKNLVMEYYRHIDKSKVQFDFICDSDSKAIPEEEITALGGRVYKIRPYQKIFSNVIDIYKICRKNKYPIVHAYNSTMNVFSMFAAKIAGVRVRISESLSMAHNDDWKTKIKKILRPMSGWFATHYMACGTDCGKWQFGEKCYKDGRIAVFKTAINTEENSYDITMRNKTRAMYGWDDKIVIGHIGRFTPQKNTLFLIDIFDAVLKKDGNAVFCLIGDGELKEKVLERISNYSFGDNMNYLGGREDIRQFYNAMDAFVLPSLYEGLPVVGLEAQSCGLPVFYSDEITQEAKVCDATHFISLNSSPDEWAELILKVTKENKQKRCSHSKDVAEAGFDSVMGATRLQGYYLNLLSEVNMEVTDK